MPRVVMVSKGIKEKKGMKEKIGCFLQVRMSG
jgi:hypothetical protein